MKYVWIVMLTIVYVIWFIASLKDFIETARHYKLKYIWGELEEYTLMFIVLHLIFPICVQFSVIS